MKKIIVFGGGMIGFAAAKRLAILGHVVTIVDIQHHETTLMYHCPDIQWYKHNFQFVEELDLSHYDLAVNCAPSKYGYNIAKHAVKSGVDCVDISFYKEDPFTLDKLARENDCVYVPDAGLAPGLTNLLFGHAYAESGERLSDVEISVGGVSKSPLDPYGYAATWSVEDLIEEYKRPAKYVFGGDIRTVHDHRVDDCIVGNDIYMEGLITDGLRTLLCYRDKVEYMKEYTLRWKGHYEQVLPYIRDGKEEELVKELKEKCSDVDDTVVLQCMFDDKDVFMKLHGDVKESAMTRATAGTCAIISQLLLRGSFSVFNSGVYPLEEIGKKCHLYLTIVSALQEREGIVVEEK